MTEDERRSALVAALTTEHVVLQTAASATVADSAARSSLYVFALSSSLVAIGFISQSPELLPLMVSIVLPALFLLGVLTVIRLVDSSLENQQCEVGIARVRRAYRTLLSPEAETYFATELGRWPEGPEPSLGLGVFIAFLGTTATMIAFINGVVAGAGVALLVDAVVDAAGIALVCGIGTVAALMALFYVFQRWRFESFALEPADHRAAMDDQNKG